MALCGQNSMHDIQPAQLSPITALPFMISIFPRGHSFAHCPHAMHMTLTFIFSLISRLSLAKDALSRALNERFGAFFALRRRAFTSAAIRRAASSLRACASLRDVNGTVR